MSLRIIEGTWEEIERHKAELIGRHLRVTFDVEKPLARKTHTPSQSASSGVKSQRVSAMGKYANILNSEDYMRRKQDEIDIEERKRS